MLIKQISEREHFGQQEERMGSNQLEGLYAIANSFVFSLQVKRGTEGF